MLVFVWTYVHCGTGGHFLIVTLPSPLTAAHLHSSRATERERQTDERIRKSEGIGRKNDIPAGLSRVSLSTCYILGHIQAVERKRDTARASRERVWVSSDSRWSTKIFDV